MIEIWHTGLINYEDVGLDKKVLYSDEFLQKIADDTEMVDVTREHSDEIIGSLSNFKYEDGVLYAEKPSDIDITGNGFSPVFTCDFVDYGSYYKPINFTMANVGLTANPRSQILYNSIETKGDGKVSDELRAMLDKKEETIAEQREEIGILKKQMEELREKSKSSDETLNEFKALQKKFDAKSQGDYASGHKCMCIETKDTFASIREASDKLNVPYHRLRSAVLSNRTVNGYTVCIDI